MMTDLNPSSWQRALLPCLACLVPLSAAGQSDTDTANDAARQFTVEVIVFRYSDAVSAGTEVFVPDPPPEMPEPRDPGERVFGDAGTEGAVPIDAEGRPIEVDTNGDPIELDADGNPLVDEPDPARADYVLLLDDELKMISTWDRLDRIDAYEPLAHFGWHQQVRPFDDAVGIPVATLGRAVPGLAGEFRLYLSRFLHLGVELALDANPGEQATEAPPAPSFSDERYLEPLAGDRYLRQDGPIVYRIDEDRIFKSGDLRYFDHPRFGVIAKIDRVERPADEDTGAAASSASR